MDAKELRIGNLVYPNEENATSWTIGGLISNALFYYEDFEGEESYEEIPFDELISIPLTEEWLLKFGFECKNKVNGGYLKPINFSYQKEFLYCSKNGVVALWNEPKSNEFIIMHNCDYVHQLQNLYFALTGEELISKN